MPFTQGYQIWLKLVRWFWRRRFFKISSMYFHYFVIFSPWKKAWPFIWTELNPTYPRMICAKFGWNWLSGAGEEVFLISSMYFHYFILISPWKRAGPFIWTNLNPLHPGILCAKFGWNRPSGSGEDFNLFLLFPNYLPFGKGVALHLNKLKCPSPRDTLCQVWLKLAQWFWRRRWKCEQFTDRQTDGQTDGETDDGRQVIRKAHLSFQLRCAKKSKTRGPWATSLTWEPIPINKHISAW